MGLLPLERYVRMIVAGRFASASLGQPTLEPSERADIARTIRDEACRPTLYPDPREYVIALGFRLCTGRVSGCGGEVTDGVRVLYRWDQDPRVRGVRVAHGLSHAYLARYARGHAEADAWLLTAEILAPARYVQSMSREGLAAVQQHAPVWMLDAWHDSLTLPAMFEQFGS